jgi:hypothetical protein
MCKQLEHLEHLEHVARNLGKFAAFQHAPRRSSAHVAFDEFGMFDKLTASTLTPGKLRTLVPRRKEGQVE